MKWIIVGADGMLGSDLKTLLNNHEVISFSKSECDITNIDVVNEKIANADVVVNCAAYTSVDAAEKNVIQANLVNAEGPKNIALACKTTRTLLVQISTDYVFAGNASRPYEVDDFTDPKSEYGKSKLKGELAVKNVLPNHHYILRTAWLYGKNGPNFVKTMLKLATTNKTIEVVNDQLGQPTWTVDLAKKIIELVEKQVPTGTYHVTSSGQTTWFNFAQKIFDLANLDPNRIKPISSENFVRPAPRPAYSVLSHKELYDVGVLPIQDWEDALKEAFDSGVFLEER